MFYFSSFFILGSIQRKRKAILVELNSGDIEFMLNVKI
jgi:hypothetical protein